MKWSKSNEDIAEVLAALGRYIDLGQIMLVGARSRDIHQEKYRPGPPARATRDIDFAVALRSWADFDLLKGHFAYPGGGWQAIKVSGFDIDLVPFGAIENPPDEVEREGLILNVHGFQEVFDSADSVSLPGDVMVKIPSVAGLAALKLHAWFDRKDRRTYKDAQDLALILAWYEEDDEIWDRYGTLKSSSQSYWGDVHCMAAQLLGSDVAQVLGMREASVLVNRFAEEGGKGIGLAQHLSAEGEHPTPFEARKEQVEALLKGISEAFDN